MARPEGFEPPTTKFVAWYSIQLSYGRTMNCELSIILALSVNVRIATVANH
jgi:hypothetical protein